VTFEQACELLDKASRHPGGRPVGSLNSGPDKLEQAVEALAAKRLGMSDEEVAESDHRLTAMLTKRWNWRSRKVRREAIRAGALAEEIGVLLAYKRSEDRVGVSRLHRAKGIHRATGAVFGYKTEPEEIVEVSLDQPAGPKFLWGADVTQAVQEELGFEPIRRRQGGRRWLAPINLEDGTNGLALDNAGIVAEPTVGELHRAQMTEGVPSVPVRLTEGEVDFLKALPVEICSPKAAWDRSVTTWHGEPMAQRGSYRAPKPELPAIRRAGMTLIGGRAFGWSRVWRSGPRMPRGDGEMPTGRFETWWRPVGAEEWLGDEWLKPEGFLPSPPATDPAALTAANKFLVLERWRAAGRPLPIVDPPGGLVQFRFPKRVIYHTTTRSILTPYIKAAVLAVYGRPLPRSPLLPR
jgi:hypothetical protein